MRTREEADGNESLDQRLRPDRAARSPGWRLERADLEVVAVNDITDARTLAHLLEFDSTYGLLGHGWSSTSDALIVGGRQIAVLSRARPGDDRLGALGADVVMEATGKFRTRDAAAAHLKGGARKVLISAPGKDVDATIVLGVNDGAYDPLRHHVISNASCTTNCVAPMVKVLHDAFGVERGFMTTIHAYTDDQMLLDGPHKDLRRARSAAREHRADHDRRGPRDRRGHPRGGREAGRRRGPGPRGGRLAHRPGGRRRHRGDRPGGERGVRRGGRRPARGHPALQHRPDRVPRHHRRPGVLRVRLPAHPGGGPLVKVFGWYDNEWGYTARLADLAALVGSRL